MERISPAVRHGKAEKFHIKFDEIERYCAWQTLHVKRGRENLDMDTFKTEYEWAESLLGRGDSAGAIGAFTRLLEESESARPRRALVLQGLARSLHAAGRAGEAVDLLREAWEILCREFGAEHPASLGAQQNLSFILQAVGRFDESMKVGESALASLIARSGECSMPVADAMIRLSASYYEADRLNEAKSLSRRAKLILDRLDPQGFAMSTCLNNLGRIAEEEGDAESGCALHRQAVAIRKRLCGNGRETAFCLGNLGTALLAAGHRDEAASVLEESLRCYALAGCTEGRNIEGLRHNLALCRK